MSDLLRARAPSSLPLPKAASESAPVLSAFSSIDPPNGRLPEMTPEGKRLSALMKSSWALPGEVQTWDVPEDFERWMVEGGAPNALIRRGWNKKSLTEGTPIIVEGFAAKDGTNRANGRDIVFPDGKKLFVGSSGTGAPDERPEK